MIEFQPASLSVPPHFDEWRPAIELVAEATLWAAHFATLLTASGGGTSSKGDASPVTAADLALQAFLVEGLRERGGDLEVVGEESTSVFAGAGGEQLRERVHQLATVARPGRGASWVDSAIDAGGADGTSSHHWIIDPIDGTRGYLRNQQYCVCLALVRDGEPVLGLAGCPRLGPRGWLMVAARGAGTHLWDLGNLAAGPRQARGGTTPRTSLIACESSDASDRARARLRRIGELLGVSLSARPMESQCKFVLVAAGEADLAIRLPSKDPAKNRDMVWDYAGAVVFAEEAGAAMSDCDGRRLRFGRGRAIDGNRGILCSASWLHDDAVAACRAADREFEIPLGSLDAGDRSGSVAG